MNQHDEHKHEGEHEKHSLKDEAFLERQSKAQVGNLV